MKKALDLVPKKRIWEVDFLRGLSILLVVWDHAMYDFARVFAEWKWSGNDFLRSLQLFAHDYIYGDLRFLWRPAFVFLFFCTSGICTALSKNNLFRGLRLWFVACIVSVVTYIVEAFSGEKTFALFGVLHCLATCILIFFLLSLLVKGATALYSKIAKKEYDKTFERWFSTALCFALAGMIIALHFVYNVKLWEMTRYGRFVWSENKWIGLFLINDKWWTADYFPLLPYIGFFFFGAGLSRILYNEKRSLLPLVDGYWNKPFCFAGRYSLFVYLGGQVLAIGLGALANLIVFGRPF